MKEKIFWQEFPRPFLALAPMEDVTDTVFRELIIALSDPRYLKVVFTEFTSTDGLCHEKGREKVMDRLRVNPSERRLLTAKNIRLVAQIWGTEPESFYHSARLISGLGEFDGLDINMGCPVKKIIRQGACSALIKHPALAREIIQATIEGSSMPVSVKTRIGFERIQTEEWIGQLLDTGISALCLHGRIQKMDSEGPVYWDEIGKAVQMKNNLRPDLCLMGNGDVLSLEEATRISERLGTDGIMIGRGVFHNPWTFSPVQTEHCPEEKLALLIRHTRLFRDTWGEERNPDILKHFYKIYANGFRGAAKLRGKLMKSTSLTEVETIVREFLSKAL